MKSGIVILAFLMCMLCACSAHQSEHQEQLVLALQIERGCLDGRYEQVIYVVNDKEAQVDAYVTWIDYENSSEYHNDHFIHKLTANEQMSVRKLAESVRSGPQFSNCTQYFAPMMCWFTNGTQASVFNKYSEEWMYVDESHYEDVFYGDWQDDENVQLNKLIEYVNEIFQETFNQVGFKIHGGFNEIEELIKKSKQEVIQQEHDDVMKNLPKNIENPFLPEDILELSRIGFSMEAYKVIRSMGTPKSIEKKDKYVQLNYDEAILYCSAEEVENYETYEIFGIDLLDMLYKGPRDLWAKNNYISGAITSFEVRNPKNNNDGYTMLYEYRDELSMLDLKGYLCKYEHMYELIDEHKLAEYEGADAVVYEATDGEYTYICAFIAKDAIIDRIAMRRIK